MCEIKCVCVFFISTETLIIINNKKRTLTIKKGMCGINVCCYTHVPITCLNYIHGSQV
jgi:hypothetical protein